MIAILGYFAAILIGISLGLIGGGGSILTVPVLVYLMRIPPITATSYSLFIVGLSSLIGSIGYMRSGLLSYRTYFFFGIPSVVGVSLSRRYILPSLPDHMFSVGKFIVDKNEFIMGLFSMLMIAASVSMIRPLKVIKKDDYEGVQRYRYFLIFIQGLLIGSFTGLIGAGGGFLIIPAMVILARLPMKMAIGTSLLIIATNSLIGFAGDMKRAVSIDWPFMLSFTALAVAGILAGTYLSRFIPGSKLKPAFGWFVLAMGMLIIIQEILRS